MIVLSILLAGTIAGPVRRLAEAAERVKRGSKEREEIPDFTSRQDEIGHLSAAIRSMTEALYDRIEAIERFAADVSHELKNPLTSLRSAVETLPLARSEESRTRLIEIVQHDVKRLDRLISDIADASRLDAELQRTKGETVDIFQLLEAVVTIQNDVRREGEAEIRLQVEPSPLGPKAYQMKGQDSRIGQVIANLLGNAKSFSPVNGEIRVNARRDGGVIEIIVDDDGPGIKVEPIERIFERFYTDRPETSFGNNSGLGLSISRQIVEAHHGTLIAQNRLGRDDTGNRTLLGARFIVRLPAS
jgi:two-component system sensor histidine kinase ChvG